MEIHEFSPFKAGSIILILQAFWNFLYILFRYALFWTSAGDEPKLSVVVALLMSLPLGWIGGATSAAIYNVVAGLFGGIRINVSINDPTNGECNTKQQLQ